MQKLPVGIQSFETIRGDSYVYVDKTDLIFDMVSTGKSYFLYRPRRFGKSLLVSTFACYFEGRKELFQGLKIAKAEGNKPEKEQWVSYPVIRFSFSGGSYNSPEGLEDILNNEIKRSAARLLPEGTVIPGETLPVRFANLIESLYRFCGKPVVVLVDEYDKPLLDTMVVNKAQEERNRTLFKNFFSVLKDEDQYLKFVFFTGVTRFSRISVFSDLNQLRDISFTDPYSSICGITEDELQQVFEDEINAMGRKYNETYDLTVQKLKRMYDGYRFSANGINLYNPFSLMNAFMDLKYGSYWFSTGTPEFLIKKLNSSRYTPLDFSEGIMAAEERISDCRAENPDPVPLFYQAGYLTIVNYNQRLDQYKLAFPNEEVSNGFIHAIYPYYFAQNSDEDFETGKFIYDLDHGDVDAFMSRLKALFASVNYPEGAQPYSEHDFQTNLFIIFSMLGKSVQTEVHSARGRADCIVKDNDLIYVFEYKIDKPAEEALVQIEEKGYAEKYAMSDSKVFLIGVSFSTEARNISDWKYVRK